MYHQPKKSNLIVLVLLATLLVIVTVDDGEAELDADNQVADNRILFDHQTPSQRGKNYSEFNNKSYEKFTKIT